jgi:hypothetical protein
MQLEIATLDCGVSTAHKIIQISTNTKKAALTTLPLHNLSQLLIIGCSRSDYHK